MSAWYDDSVIYAVYRKVFSYSLMWLLASNSFVVINLGYYVVNDWLVMAQHFKFFWMLLLLVYIASAVCICLCLRRPVWSPILWHASAFLSGCLWSLLAFSVHYVWAADITIDKIVIIAFFTLLIAWYARLELLLSALSPLFACCIIWS